jgi:hypothetical protein
MLLLLLRGRAAQKRARLRVRKPPSKLIGAKPLSPRASTRACSCWTWQVTLWQICSASIADNFANGFIRSVRQPLRLWLHYTETREDSSHGRDGARRWFQRRLSAPTTADMSTERRCINCGCISTPLWRRSPLGPKTLVSMDTIRAMKSIHIVWFAVFRALTILPAQKGWRSAGLNKKFKAHARFLHERRPLSSLERT